MDARCFLAVDINGQGDASLNCCNIIMVIPAGCFVKKYPINSFERAAAQDGDIPVQQSRTRSIGGFSDKKIAGRNTLDSIPV